MASQAKSRKKTIEPLDWISNAQSPALKGLVSFLDITPESLRGIQTGPGPVERNDPGEIKPPVENQTPAAIETPVAIKAPAPNNATAPINAPSAKFAPVAKAYPVAKKATVAFNAAGVSRGKIIRCRFAQDGHTHTEETVYKVLWDATKPTDRTVCIGFAELAREARLSKRTMSTITRKLAEKLSIEVIGNFNSNDMTPKTYKVFSYKEILDRRREAGLEYVIRTKGGGLFFATPEGEEIVLGGESPVEENAPVEINNPGEGFAAGEVYELSKFMNRFWTVDEAAASQLLQSCRSVRQDATLDEIRFFVSEKVSLVQRSQTINNPTGLILSTVPQCFEGRTFEEFRSRRIESLRLQAEEAARKEEQDRALMEWLKKSALRILADPSSSPQQRIQAENELRSLS